MVEATINTHKAVEIFHKLMQPSSSIQTFCLTGAAKMGKSHLLTEVFPALACQQYRANYAFLDLRNRMHTIPDLLQIACIQLGTEFFTGYYTAYKEWINRPAVEVQGLLAAFSSISIAGRQTPKDTRHAEYYLTSQFVNDLNKQTTNPVVFFFDSIECADQAIQVWLMETLLIPLSQLKHIRLVLAGRPLPEAHPRYRNSCQWYELQPITELHEYIDYCQRLNARLVEQSIRDFAHACDYIPGLFVDLVVPKFVPQRILHGSHSVARTSGNE